MAPPTFPPPTFLNPYVVQQRELHQHGPTQDARQPTCHCRQPAKVIHLHLGLNQLGLVFLGRLTLPHAWVQILQLVEPRPGIRLSLHVPFSHFMTDIASTGSHS